MTKSAEYINIIIDSEVIDRYAAYYFENHPRARKKPILHPYHESINAWMIMRRPMMNALKQKWKDFIVWFSTDIGVADRRIQKCIITQTVYYPTRRRHDTDNSVPKFILDGLVASGVIVDDDMKCVTELSLKCGIDSMNPRTEIEIRIL